MNFAIALPGALFVGFSLGIFGSGGSILTVPILVYLLGQDEKVAIASSLAIVGLVAAAGSVPYIKQKLVHWRTVLLFGAPGIAGTYLGAWSSTWVSGTVQLVTFAIVMFLAAFLMLKPFKPGNARPSAPRAFYKIAVDGLAVGMLTGFVGVGGGFLIVPALVLLGGLAMQRAIATSLVIITMKSAAGYLKYLDILDAQGLEPDLLIISWFAVAGIIGSFAGNSVALMLPQEHLKKGFAVFLIIMAFYILAKSAPLA